MTDEGETTSADQDAWIDLARRLRSELEKLIPTIGAMKPDEVKTLVDAINQTRWLNLEALAFDKSVANENAKLPYGN